VNSAPRGKRRTTVWEVAVKTRQMDVMVMQMGRGGKRIMAVMMTDVLLYLVSSALINTKP
jgi:hypothetical protein